MKKLSVIALIVLMSAPAFSQVKFGLKAGLSTSSLSMPSVKTITSGSGTYQVEALTQAKYGFHGGVFARVTLLGLFVQPELLFSNRTNEYNITDPASAISVAKQTFNKIDIPVMLGVKLGPVRLNAGPAASLLINTPKDIIDDPDLKSNYSRMTFGYQAGLGVDVLNKLTVDLRFEGSLKKYQNQIEALSGTKVNLDDRASAFLISLGLIF